MRIGFLEQSSGMVVSDPMTGLHVLSSLGVILAGLTMVALAARAYFETEHTPMLHLCIGFTFIVAAALATTVPVLLGGADTVVLLSTNYAITTVGFAFVIYSVVSR